MSSIDAVVMAGGSAATLDPGAPYKGAVEIAGKPMVEWVVDALCATEEVGKVVVTVPTSEKAGSWADKADAVVESNGSFSENALAGIAKCEGATHILVCTGDIPTLTPEALSKFLRKFLKSNADFSYPVISQEVMERQLPGSRRTYFTLDGDKYTGGNVAVVPMSHVVSMQDLGQKVFDARKNPIEMAKIAGPSLLMKFARGKLDTETLESRVSQILDARCLAQKVNYASLGADVDKPGDIAVVEQALSK